MDSSFKSRLFGQDAIFKSIRESFTELPHIFITGPPGSGKTTFLEDFISLLKLEAPFRVDSVLWLTSEKDRGIHTIREKVNDFCKRTHSTENTLRWIVIDDADTLPLISQQALRRPMETFSHLTRFIFASRYVSNLIEPLRSRCQNMELEPIGIIQAYPLYLDVIEIPKQHRTQALFSFCLTNFVSVGEIKRVLQLYKASVENGESSSSALKTLEFLLPASKIHTQSLLQGLEAKDSNAIRESITKLFLNGYLLDDILLCVERSISVFPSTDPTVRFRILQFTMLGWIFIQQGKEHWLDTMDIIDQVLKIAP